MAMGYGAESIGLRMAELSSAVAANIKYGSIAICVGWLLPEGSVPGSLGRWNSSSHKLWV